MVMVYRIILIATVFVSSALGSLGFRTDNKILGFICVLIAIFVLFYLARFLWHVVGIFMTFALVIGAVLAILYITGAFDGGIDGVKKRVAGLTGGSTEEAPEPDRDAVYGQAIALTGDTLSINGEAYALYGLKAPYMEQSCTGARGGAYLCGELARNYLAGLLAGQQPVCIKLESAPMTSKAVPVVCNIGAYDLGALLVVEGWAVANIHSGGEAYVPYEQKARELKHGLWQGSFIAPWDWMAQQNDQKRRMGTIKVPESPRKKGKIYIKDHWLK